MTHLPSSHVLSHTRSITQHVHSQHGTQAGPGLSESLTNIALLHKEASSLAWWGGAAVNRTRVRET